MPSGCLTTTRSRPPSSSCLSLFRFFASSRCVQYVSPRVTSACQSKPCSTRNSIAPASTVKRCPCGHTDALKVAASYAAASLSQRNAERPTWHVRYRTAHSRDFRYRDEPSSQRSGRTQGVGANTPVWGTARSQSAVGGKRSKHREPPPSLAAPRTPPPRRAR